MLPLYLMILSVAIALAAILIIFWQENHPPAAPPFCYFMVTWGQKGDPGPWPLSVVNMGRDPIGNVSIEIWDKSALGSVFNAPTYPIGDVEPHTTPRPPNLPRLGAGSYVLIITTRSGQFSETLNIHKRPDGIMDQSIIVTGQVGGKVQTVFSTP